MKRLIRAQAMPKDKALQRSKFYSEDIIEHVIKILLYHDIRKDDVDHWISEIASWLADADNIVIKTSGKKLKPNDIENTTFGWMGTDLSDYSSVLNMFRHKNRQGRFNCGAKESYPDFEVTRETAETLMDVCYDIINETVPLICEKKDHSSSEYKVILKEIFKRYI